MYTFKADTGLVKVNSLTRILSIRIIFFMVLVIMAMAGLQIVEFSPDKTKIIPVNALNLSQPNPTLNSFASIESPSFLIKTDSALVENNKREEISKMEFGNGQVSAVIKSPDGKVADIKPVIKSGLTHKDELLVSVPPVKKFTPGKYKLIINIESYKNNSSMEQDFTWGVLALNIPKSSYRIDESASFGLAVLDDKGKTLCDAKVVTEIVTPSNKKQILSTQDNTIKVSDTCEDKNFTDEPDYKAIYIPREAGEYSVVVKADTVNGTRTAISKLWVVNEPDITTERLTATRIYPINSYKVTTNIDTKKELQNEYLEEQVPSTFDISSVELNLEDRSSKIIKIGKYSEKIGKNNNKTLRLSGINAPAGSRLILSYSYKAPPVSPAFYELGPLKIGDNNFVEPRSWQIAGDSIGDVILLWDSANGAIPSGWTCVSCTSGDAFFQLFPRAAASYGASTAGGPESVSHTFTQPGVSTVPSATFSALSGVTSTLVVGSGTHTYSGANKFADVITGATNIRPPFQNLKFIKATNPSKLPQNIIGLFDVPTASLPGGWTHYSPLDGNYLRGENDNLTGGSATHTHTRGTSTSGANTSTFTGTTTLGATPASTSNHTHTIATGSTTADNNDPAFATLNFARQTTSNSDPPNGLIAMFDNSSLPIGWNIISNSAPYQGNLLKGAGTAGTTGGRTAHDHGGSQVLTSGPPSATTANIANTGTAVATSTHTHDATFTISSANSMPVYRDVILGKLSAITVSGTVYSDEGVTTLGSLPIKTGIVGTSSRTTTASAGGTYSMTIPDPGVGGLITTWLDTNGGASGSVVTRGNSANITGLDIYQNRLVVSHEDTGPLTNTNIGLCDKTTGSACTDSDMHFDESSGSLVVDNDWRLFIKAGKTYTPGGSVTLNSGGTSSSMGGDLKWGSSGSTFNISANSLSVGGDWINSAGGTFTKSAGQNTTFTANSSGFTIDSSSKNFEKVTFNGVGGAWSFSPSGTAVNIDNDFTINNGSVTAPSANLSVGGSWLNGGTFTHNTGTVVMNATSTGKTINNGSSNFYNLTLNGAGGAWSPLTNAVIIAGDLSMTAGTFDTSSGSADVTVNGSVQGTNGVINMSSTNTFTQRVSSNKNFGASSGANGWTFNNLRFSNSGASPVTITTLTGGSGNLTINGNMTVSTTGDIALTSLNAGNRTWKLSNTNSSNPFDLDQAGGTLTSASSTFEYLGKNNSGDVTVQTATYNNLTFGGVSVANYIPENQLVVNQNILINANATLIGAQNITVGGNTTGSGSINLSGGIFLQRVATGQTFGTTSGANDWTFSNLRFENSSVSNQTITTNTGGTGKLVSNGILSIGNVTDTATTTLDDNTANRIVDANSDVNITSKGGLLAPPSASFTIAGSFVNNGTFTANGGTVVFDSTNPSKTISGSLTSGNKFNNLIFNGIGGSWSFGVSSVDIGSNLTITNGTLTAPSTTLTISGNYSNAGTFSHNNGLLVFNSTASGKTINPGVSSPLNNVNFNGIGGGWTIQTNPATIAGDLLVIAGTLGATANITANGQVQCSTTCGTINLSSGTFTQSVSADKNFGTNVAVATDWTFNNLTLVSASGTRVITTNSLGTGKIIVNGNLSTVNSGATLSINNFTNNRIFDINTDVSIGANTTFRASASALFSVFGSWSNNGTFEHNNGAVTFDGTASGKTIDNGTSNFYNMTLNGAGGVWSPRTNTLRINNDIVLTAGTLGAAGDTSDIIVNGNASGTGGIVNISAAGRTFTQRVSSDKNFGSTGAGANWSFVNLTFSNSNASSPITATTLSGTGTMSVSGILSVGASGDSAGAVTNMNAGDRTWTLSGVGGNPFQLLSSPNAVFIPSTSTVTYSGDYVLGNTNILPATYYKLKINNAAETYNTTSAVIVNSDLAVTAGLLSMGANNLTVGSSAVINSGSILVAGSFSQTSGATTFIRSSSSGSATIGGAGTITFYNLTLDPSVAGGPTILLGSAASQLLTVNNNFTVGNGTNPVTVTAQANNPNIDVNGDVSITNNASLIAPASANFSVAGSWSNSGTFTHNSGAVNFDSASTGKTISGTLSGSSSFNKIVFNNSGGGWTINNNLSTASDVTLTAITTSSAIGLVVPSSVTVDVGGTYSFAQSNAPDGTNWATSSTLFLNPLSAGTNYTVGSKSQTAEVYGNLTVANTANIRMWSSTASGTVTVSTTASNGSLYSQNHANNVGRLNIYGNYQMQGVSNDYWAYNNDFDGTALSGASKRQAIVRIESGVSNKGVTIPSAKSITIKGGGGGALQCTDVDRLGSSVTASCNTLGTGGSSNYQLVNSTGSAVQLENSKFNNANFNGGNWTNLNTINSNPVFTAGIVVQDWYLAIDAVDRDSTSSPITTGASDISVCEATVPDTNIDNCGNSGSSALTVFKESGGSWGGGATSQSNGTNGSGLIPQPDNNGAMRIREYSNNSGSATYYQYNLLISAQAQFAHYNYKRDFGKYLTSSANTGSSESQVIGNGWYRDNISVQNSRPASVNSLSQITGTWWIGPAKAIIILWDGAGNAPAGWVCVSCSPGQPFYQKFVRATTSYGATAGSDTGGHDLVFSNEVKNGAGTTGGALTNTASADVHTHTWNYSGSPNTTTSDIKPPYRQLKFIRGPVSGVWPAGVIAPFDTVSLPTNWSSYSAMDGNYLRGEQTVANGGATTHTHDANAITSSGSSATGAVTCTASCATVPALAHTHSLSAQALTSSNNDPLFVQRVFYKLSSSSAPPADVLGFFDYSSSVSGWTTVSNSAPYQNNLIKGGTSLTSGGNSTHNHGGSLSRTSSVPGGGTVTSNALSGVLASSTHTHSVTHTINSSSNMPAYIDAVIMKYGGSTGSPPGVPTALSQKKTNDSVLSTGDWTNETSVKLSATVTDVDPGDTIKICAEVKPINTAFTSPAGDGDGCSSVAVSTASTALITLSGLADDTQYHWQIKAKDASGTYSSWVGYGGNVENPPTNPADRDFGIDTSPPATATIYDNTNTDSQPLLVDRAENGDGSLTTLSASWGAFNANSSGILKYEYSIGTTVAATDIKSWTDNGTATSVRTNGLSLQTNKTYFINVRATDNATNLSSVASSNGQYVTPTLTFDLDIGGSSDPGSTNPPYSIDFGVLSVDSVVTSPSRAWLSLSSNSSNGSQIYIKGLNASLNSALASYNIISTTSDLSAVETGYGAQISTITHSSGSALTAVSPYNGAGNNVGIIDTSLRQLLYNSGSIVGGRASINLKAKIKNTTPASNDYNDTITIVSASAY